MAIHTTDTRNMTRAEWVEARRKGLGGSDAAAIIGLNPYATPYALWADKTGRLPETEDNEAMRQGRDLEPYVVKRFEEATGKRCRRRNAILRNDAYPWAHANIDREIIGERAGFEAKTTSTLNLRRFRDGEYPATYYIQCMHYLAVTGWDRWYLGVLILGQGFLHFVIERDEDEIAALMGAESDFWRLVESDTPPPVDGLPATSDALATVYRDADGSTVELFGREDVARQYLALGDQIKALKKEQSLLAQVLKTDMQQADTGICGSYTVQWRQAIRTSVSLDLLRKRYPKIGLSKVMRVSRCRRFAVKEVKQ